MWFCHHHDLRGDRWYFTLYLFDFCFCFYFYITKKYLCFFFVFEDQTQKQNRRLIQIWLWAHGNNCFKVKWHYQNDMLSLCSIHEEWYKTYEWECHHARKKKKKQNQLELFMHCVKTPISIPFDFYCFDVLFKIISSINCIPTRTHVLITVLNLWWVWKCLCVFSFWSLG